jgi:nitrite reductase (NADH) large subunit
MERLVVIGNGMAGQRFLEALVERDPSAYAMTAIGAEPVPAYNRVLLSSLLARDVAEEAIRYRGREWYADHGIGLRLGAPVAAIDTGAGAIALADGDTVPFDRLVLATGSLPIRLPLPGMELDRVLTFRDLADVDRIAGLASRARRAVVIGGGLLGLEAAWGLARAGIDTTVVHLMDRLMERQLDARAALFLKTAIERKGIDVLLEARTEAITGDGTVDGLALKDGRRIEADMVVVAVGIQPAKQLALAAGLACNRGIVVDDRLATSAAGIYAIGECAEHRGACYGLVEPAYDQARILARNLAGETAAYEGSVVATNLKVSGVNVFSAGDFLGGDGTDVVTLADPGALSYRKLVLAGDRLVGAILVGDTSDSVFYQDLIRSGRSVAAMRNDLIFGRAMVASEAA